MSITNKSYTKNYFKTYLWQGISIVLNVASMFIVIPMITDNKVVYGVYSVSISTAMFLSYADLGFVSAVIKYAGESFARGEKKMEIRLFGFSSFILFIFVTLIALIYLLFSLYPSLLIKDINKSAYLTIASQLLLIQAIFSYNTVLQRFVTGIFQIRIEQYVYQHINIIGALIKIGSVFYFFGAKKYDIVGYYLFIKIIELLTLLVGLYLINKKYEISIIEFFKSIKFDRYIYKKVKNLALSSIFVTIMWVLYYELDIIAIGYFLGASAVAIFALAFIFMKFLRSLSATIFSPFQNRYNHLVGLNDIDGLKALLNKVILFSMPIFVLIIMSIIFLSKNIVLSWAGIEYMQSGIILSLLAINFMYSFIVIPGANMLVALVRTKEMYWINFIMVVVFWSGIFLTKDYFSVNSFAIFKLVAGTIAMLFYCNVLLKFLKISFSEFLQKTIFKLGIPIIIEVIFLFLVRDYLPVIKGKINFFIVLSAGGIGTIIGFIILFFTSKYYNYEFRTYFTKIKKAFT